MVFAVITIVAVLLCWILGVYAVYTWREIELEKLKQAKDSVNKALREFE